MPRRRIAENRAALVTLGLIYLPAAIVIGFVAAVLGALPFFREVFQLAGTESGSGLIIAALIGSLANVAAFVGVNAMVAGYLATIGTPEETSPAAAGRRALGLRRELVGGLLRSYAIVIGLLLTIVGTPWAIRQLVRYQFMPQVVTLEGEGPKEALERSSMLVTGRWWHTGSMVIVINGSIAAAGLGIGLLLLVLVPQLPLWLFSSLITLVYALVAPVGAIAMTLLYGDAVAHHDSDDASEPDEGRLAAHAR